MPPPKEHPKKKTKKSLGNAAFYVTCSPIIVPFIVYNTVDHAIMRTKRWIGRARAGFPPVYVNQAYSNDQSRLQRRQRNLPRALPERRPRALTLTSQSKLPPAEPEKPEEGKKKEKAKKKAQKTIEQLGTCDLYKLPPELRLKIWRLVIGDNYIHIVKKRARLGYVYCLRENPGDPTIRDMCDHPKDGLGFCETTAYAKDVGLLHLALTCRQIYSETIGLLYSCNTFSFTDLDAFLPFCQNTLPQRLNSITSIDLSWYMISHSRYPENQHPPADVATWTSVCNRLASMSSLHTLNVHIQDSKYTNPFISFSYKKQQRHNVYPIVPRFMDALCNIKLMPGGKFTVYTAYSPSHPLASQHPQNPPFKIRSYSDSDIWTTHHILSEYTRVEFWIPFTIRCLHCGDKTLIQKDTKGYAERCEVERDGIRYLNYWTWHSHCRGWMEFEYNQKTLEYKTVFGAEREDIEK